MSTHGAGVAESVNASLEEGFFIRIFCVAVVSWVGEVDGGVVDVFEDLEGEIVGGEDVFSGDVFVILDGISTEFGDEEISGGVGGIGVGV